MTCYTQSGYNEMIFIESKIFERLRQKYFDDASYNEFQNFLLEQPLVGDIIQGTGGLKKVRWAAQGKGKRGGVRIIYFYLANRE